MNKNILTKIIINLLLLLFVVVWVLPTFGLFVSSFRDKDLLATSGWWTTFKTNEVNEIYRTKTFEDQFEENGSYFISGNLLDINSGKKIIRYGIIIEVKILNSLAPSILAASNISFGIPLSAALKITIARPVCIQIIIAIKNKLFQTGIVIQACGSKPKETTTAFKNPI